MSKETDLFIKSQLDMMDKQFIKMQKELDKLYKYHVGTREELLNKLSRTILEFEVKSNYLELTKRQQQDLMKGIQLSLFDMVEKELSYDVAFMEDAFNKVIADTYNYSSFLLSLGIDFEMQVLTDRQISIIVNKKIAGEIWSKRLWFNKKHLEVMLKENIKKCFKGEVDINKIYTLVRQQFEQDNKNVKRLVNTELARVQQGAIDKFCEDNDIEWQMFVATLDGKTSKVCQGFDGDRFRVDDKNKPVIPLHPNCRSVIVSIPGEDYKPGSRRNNETDESIKYLTYEEWKK